MKLGIPGRTVKLGVIGLGCRGEEQLKVLLSMEDVQIPIVCDVYADRVEKAQKMIEEKRGVRPLGTTDYHEVNTHPEVEAVIIMTSWQTHIEIACDAMKHGKIPGSEVGGASSIDECWKLVRTCEQTGVPMMLLENCCYNDVEMALLRMIREGLFGEVVHCKGGYRHDLRDEVGEGDINRHYRQDHFMNRNGELYPTHELGPIAEYLNLNRGNRMLTLVSMASKAVGEHAWLMENRADAPALQQAAFTQGDVVTTLIKCAHGETIVLTHDCTLPRPYSRDGSVQGTKGLWEEEGHQIYLEATAEKKHHWDPDKATLEQYEHPLWKEYREFGLRGGHGGMDYLVLRAFIESIQNNRPFPIDVYDAASWMAVTCLSEQSIAMGSMLVPVPDFTDGRWLKPAKREGDMYSLDEVCWDAFKE